MTPDLVIFDCDGVLIDSEIIACEIEAKALTAAGYEVSAEAVAERFIGRPSHDVMREVEGTLGCALPPDFGDRIDAEILAAYRDRLRPLPGVGAAVERLSAARCVASSSAPSKLFGGLLAAGLVELFYPHIYSTVLVEQGKPAPDLFQLAANRCGARPDATVVIEDSPSGVEAGRRAGMAVIGFIGGAHCGPGHAERLRARGAHAILNHFDMLDEVIALGCA